MWQGVPFILNKLLPPNAYEMVSGRVTVFVTQLFPWQGVGVSEFRSNEDLSQVGLHLRQLPMLGTSYGKC